MLTQVDESRRRLLAAALILAVSSAAPPALLAQGESAFVPVTDAMLQAPAPGDWPMWRRTLDGWGYSPLERDRTAENVARPAPGLVARPALTAGASQQGTPLVYDGVMYMPNPRDVIQAHRCGHRRSAAGSIERPLSAEDIAERIVGGLEDHQPEPGHLRQTCIIDTSADDHIFALDAADGPARVGHGDPRLQDGIRPDQSHRPDHRQRQGHLRTELPAAPPGPTRASSPRTTRTPARSSGGTSTIPRPGEPGDESWGGVPVRGALARRGLDGAELRPGAEPDLHGHLGDLAGAEVHAGRRRRTSTSITTPRWRSTATRARSPGTRCRSPTRPEKTGFSGATRSAVYHVLYHAVIRVCDGP